MSSSFKQKKMKTLATRKKTRKRKMIEGMVADDESGRLFQPPSVRDPRWKKPSLSGVVSQIVSKKKQKLNDKSAQKADADDDESEGDEDDEIARLKDENDAQRAARSAVGAEDDDDDSFELAPAAASSDDEQGEDEAEEEEEEEVEVAPTLPLRQCASIDKCVEVILAAHRTIRKSDGRQKAKVLIVADTPALTKALVKALNIKTERVKPKSRLGLSSAKKPLMVYRNVGLLKTPMEKFEDKNKGLLKDFKIGKVVTLLTEDNSFFHYSALPVQHCFFLVKNAATLLNLDLAFTAFVQPQFLISGDALSAEDKANLAKKFILS